MHSLPRVREIEEAFGDAVSVVGVHAGKYTAERQTERIRHGCERLGVTHPVVNDRHYRIWRSYAVDAWPTLVIVDANGYVAGVARGEFDPSAVHNVVEMLVDQARTDGVLDERPLEFGPDPRRLLPPEGPLRYPGAVASDGERLLISDTGNRRVLLCTWNDPGSVAVERSWSAPTIELLEPRGAAFLGRDIYVADRRGHTVVRLERDGTASTVAGTGQLGAGRIAEGNARTALRSPWALSVRDDELLVAMAGSHQLWKLAPSRSAITLLAGSGAEEIYDGPARRAALAQPTGVATAGDTILLAECESSAIRAVGPDERVSTIVGTGLFDWGDRDGRGDEVRLQHAQDLAVLGDSIYVADTYNDKIKVVDPTTRSCAAMPGAAGSGEVFSEPGGITTHEGRLIVADTNNHRIAVVSNDGTVETVAVEGA